MNCYNLETLNYKDGLFDDFIEATYILTMENSDRRKDYMYQLEQFKPSSVVHIFHNKGFKKCEKKLNDKVIENSVNDIIHAYKNAFTHAKKSGYKNILILEDDFIFSHLLKQNYIIKRIEKMYKHLENSSSAFLLGCLPQISFYYPYYYRYILSSAGAHAIMYNEKSINNILNNIDSFSDYDFSYKFYVNCYCYKEPLVYQLVSETENRNNWGMNIPIIGTIIGVIIVWVYQLLELDKKHEPGTTYVYNFNVFLYDFVLLFAIIYVIRYYLFKYLFSNKK
jgi:hypothetical protein